MIHRIRKNPCDMVQGRNTFIYDMNISPTEEQIDTQRVIFAAISLMSFEQPSVDYVRKPSMQSLGWRAGD